MVLRQHPLEKFTALLIHSISKTIKLSVSSNGSCHLFKMNTRIEGMFGIPPLSGSLPVSKFPLGAMGRSIYSSGSLANCDLTNTKCAVSRWAHEIWVPLSGERKQFCVRLPVEAQIWACLRSNMTELCFLYLCFFKNWDWMCAVPPGRESRRTTFDIEMTMYVGDVPLSPVLVVILVLNM